MEITEQIGGEFGVTVRYTTHANHVEFFAAAVTGVEDERLLYWRKGSDSSLDASDFNEAERYIDGSVKWDGCSHFTFGDENGYLHLCGETEIKKLAQVVGVIYERCGELMKAEGGNLPEGEFAVSRQEPTSPREPAGGFQESHEG